ncbi:MAG: nuclear transport factor 2 family protein [Acidobacteria bacterium]|nr:nuclear transport factor 2 family protein [Acidobacteriota bacterium]
MSGRSNVEVVQNLFAAFGRADIPGVLALLAGDVAWVFPGPPSIPFAGERNGHAGATEFFTALGGAVEFEQFEVRELVAQGDKVVALGFERGRGRASGRTFENHWALVFTVRGGKVTHFRSYEDTAALAEAFRAG